MSKILVELHNQRLKLDRMYRLLEQHLDLYKSLEQANREVLDIFIIAGNIDYVKATLFKERTTSLDELNMRELRSLAFRVGVVGFMKLHKQDLIGAIDARCRTIRDTSGIDALPSGCSGKDGEGVLQVRGIQNTRGA